MRAGIYVHIPFCIKKCHYCSFNSVPYDKKTSLRYLSALHKEINGHVEEVEPTSLYIGGGTPTVLPGDGLFDLIGFVRERFGIPRGMEATVEANPGTLDGLDIKRLLGQGINRISLGAQSFNPAELKMLGRLHGPEEVGRAVKRLRSGGVLNIGLDLMYSLPGQDLAGWSQNLRHALELLPQHLSLYDLTLEEDTPLYSEVKAGRLTLPPEPVQVEMYLLALDIIEKAGYVRYEISNFALPGFECRHNLNYWSGGDYLGFGAGAHSHISGVRTENLPGVPPYIEAMDKGASPVLRMDSLSQAEREREFIMLGLRTSSGISLDEYARRFGHGFMDMHGGRVEELEKSGFMLMDSGSARLTVKGVLASNYVIREFF